MGYQHIQNLYKDQSILAQTEVYALEKIHGTSAHIAFERIHDEVNIRFFSGGEKHENFAKLFDVAKLCAYYRQFHSDKYPKLTIYGEAYGGKCQSMSGTYGPDLKFVAFEVCVDQDTWLDIPNAHSVAEDLRLEFVYYSRIPTTLVAIDDARDADSFQAFRNGMGTGKMMEGVVLFPIKQQLDFRGNRLIAKHKRDEFRETKTPRAVTEVPVEIINAQKAAHEFVTEMRLNHVLDKIPDHRIEMMREIMAAMIEDILREGAGEVVDSPAFRKEISRRTAILYKDRLKKVLSADFPEDISDGDGFVKE